MPVIIEEMPLIPERGSRGQRFSKDGKPSDSFRAVEKLRALSPGQCVTILPETDDPKELERKRSLWVNAAHRAGLGVVSRLVVTETGDRAMRIWRSAP